MRNFAYARPDNAQAVVNAASSGAVILAGGTELLNWLRLGISSPDTVIDISRLDGLREIEMDGDTLQIGALATLNEIEASPFVREHAPVLSQACLKAASPQLRNRATIGGNVLQKTRCPYFRAEAPMPEHMPWPCNKRIAGSGCAALHGHYDRAALFGWTESCVATQPSDPAVALAALDAVMEITGPCGRRSVTMTGFHLTQSEAAAMAGSEEAEAIYGTPVPGGADAAALLENRLHAGELITACRIPVDAASRRSAYLKVRERESYEYAMVSAAVCLHSDGDRISSIRIALGSVAQKPWRLTQSEAALQDASFEEDALNAALDLSLAEARALPHQSYKIRLARNAARRAIHIAGGRRND
jgi:xanthine dehydrogenase YagS FAD-binding subunit